MYRIFSLSLAYGKSSDKSWDYAGLGVRVDLPGVFLVNANPSEFVRRNKRRNLNTYFAAMKLITKRGGESQKFVSDKFGLGMDIFMAGSLYLNTELNLFSFEGNQFFSPSVGLGFEF